MIKQLKWFLFAFLFSMAALGVANTVNGPVTTSMMQQLGIIESQRGLLLTLQGSGTILSVLVWALWGEKTNKLLVTVIGAALIMTASVVMMINMGYYALMPIFLVYGFGFTCIDVMCNAVAMDVYPTKKNTVLLIHAFFGIGAVVGSIVSSGITDSLGWQYAFLLLAAILLVVILVYGSTALKAYPMMSYASKPKQRAEKLAIGIMIRRGEAWAMFFAALFFGASQLGPVIWLNDYYKNTLHVGSLAAYAVAALFIGTIASRLLSTILMKRFSPRRLFLVGALLAGGMYIGLSFTGDGISAIIFTVLAGFFAGANYPLLVVMGSRIFPRFSATVSSILCLGYAVCTMTIPWLMGVLAKASTMGMRLSFILVAVFTFLMVVCILPVKLPSEGKMEQDTTPTIIGEDLQTADTLVSK